MSLTAQIMRFVYKRNTIFVSFRAMIYPGSKGLASFSRVTYNIYTYITATNEYLQLTRLLSANTKHTRSHNLTGVLHDILDKRTCSNISAAMASRHAVWKLPSSREVPPVFLSYFRTAFYLPSPSRFWHWHSVHWHSTESYTQSLKLVGVYLHTGYWTEFRELPYHRWKRNHFNK